MAMPTEHFLGQYSALVGGDRVAEHGQVLHAFVPISSIGQPRLYFEPLTEGKMPCERGQHQSQCLTMLSFMTSLAISTAIIAVCYIYRRVKLRKLPPGPPPLPLIGNLHQAPKKFIWLTFKKWVDQYGPLVSVDFVGTRLILVGDYETARDLLDKRSSIYSSRPRMVSSHDVQDAFIQAADELDRSCLESLSRKTRTSCACSSMSNFCYTSAYQRQS
jgi:hypothetical protein